MPVFTWVPEPERPYEWLEYVLWSVLDPKDPDRRAPIACSRAGNVQIATIMDGLVAPDSGLLVGYQFCITARLKREHRTPPDE